MMMGKEKYGSTLLRLTIGLLFVITGISKLMNPSGITSMLQQIGFPTPAFWAWIVLLVEIIFGLAVLVGFRVKYTTWPLTVILAVAILTVHIPAMKDNPMGIINVFFHLIAVAGLISLSLTGSGAVAVSED